MCQVQEGHDGPEKARSSFRTTCMRCDEHAVVELKAYDLVFCRLCFLNYFTHKFRSTIGKSKLVKKGEKVLLAFSGGQSSSAMLKLVKEGLCEETHKKLRFHPGVIYIDEGAVTGQNVLDRERSRDQIQSIMGECGFPGHIKALEEVVYLDDAEQTTDSGKPVEAAKSNEIQVEHGASENMAKLMIDDRQSDRLQELLSNTKTLTAKEDLVQNMRNKLLLHVARKNKYDKVMVGNSGTNLSVCILSDLAKGRGAAVPLDTNFADHRHGDILFLRPMREFTSKEIAIYNRFQDIEPVVMPTLTTKAAVNASINHLTEAFVTNLQVNFPSTVNTVFRTGEKLCDAKSRSTESKNCCVMCQALLDTTVGTASALKSTEFSLSLMKEKTRNTKPTSQSADGGRCSDSSECCGQGDGSCRSNPRESSLSKEQVNEYLCYACRVTLRDVKDVNCLPRYIAEEVSMRTRRSHMKAEIEGFLLDESD